MITNTTISTSTDLNLSLSGYKEPKVYSGEKGYNISGRNLVSSSGDYIGIISEGQRINIPNAGHTIIEIAKGVLAVDEADYIQIQNHGLFERFEIKPVFFLKESGGGLSYLGTSLTVKFTEDFTAIAAGTYYADLSISGYSQAQVSSAGGITANRTQPCGLDTYMDTIGKSYLIVGKYINTTGSNLTLQRSNDNFSTNFGIIGSLTTLAQNTEFALILPYSATYKYAFMCTATADRSYLKELHIYEI